MPSASTPDISLPGGRRFGIFGRSAGGRGPAVDFSLENGALRKAFAGLSPGRSLNDLIALASRVMTDGRATDEHPVAIVGMALGPGLTDPDESAWSKSDFNEDEHPRWLAGNGDMSGEFKDKDGDSSGERRMGAAMGQGMILKDLQRRIERRLARKLLRNRLIATLRFGAGIAADVAPVAGEVFDAAELAQTVADFHEMHIESDAAIQFVQGGTRELDALRASLDDEGFSSSRAFAKEDLDKRFGPAGDGYEYHHIVEQGGPNGRNIAPEILHSTQNMIRIPKIIHEEISAIYGQEAPDTEGLNLRDWLSTKSFEVQRARGLKIMRNLGIIW